MLDARGFALQTVLDLKNRLGQEAMSYVNNFDRLSRSVRPALNVADEMRKELQHVAADYTALKGFEVSITPPPLEGAGIVSYSIQLSAPNEHAELRIFADGNRDRPIVLDGMSEDDLRLACTTSGAAAAFADGCVDFPEEAETDIQLVVAHLIKIFLARQKSAPSH